MILFDIDQTEYVSFSFFVKYWKKKTHFTDRQVNWEDVVVS